LKNGLLCGRFRRNQGLGESYVGTLINIIIQLIAGQLADMSLAAQARTSAQVRQATRLPALSAGSLAGRS
jgi:hypothetical protein